ncbi:MAG: DUF1049 domain-containing protein [Phyllobacteriaceae bacterium]|nr:DUF1049 domain-containing protein [Phyllobacteriaceae bacterium]
MRRFFRWLVGAPIAIIVIAFAVANRRWVTLSLDPFSQDAPFAAIDMPLWLLLFVGGFIGILVGWFGSWLAQGKWRKAARDSKAEVALLQKELADLRKTDAGYSRQEITTSSSTFPGGLM